jgi:hypothetical protein
MMHIHSNFSSPGDFHNDVADFLRIAIHLASHPARRLVSDENLREGYGGGGKFKDATGRGFRSLSKAFDKERYAKVEVMSSSPWNGTR